MKLAVTGPRAFIQNYKIATTYTNNYILLDFYTFSSPFSSTFFLSFFFFFFAKIAHPLIAALINPNDYCNTFSVLAREPNVEKFLRAPTLVSNDSKNISFLLRTIAA